MNHGLVLPSLVIGQNSNVNIEVNHLFSQSFEVVIRSQHINSKMEVGTQQKLITHTDIVTVWMFQP